MTALRRAGCLQMFTIYSDTVGTLTYYSVREFLITSREEPVAGTLFGVVRSLEAARALVPGFASVCLTRAEIDDPHIVETWI